MQQGRHALRYQAERVQLDTSILIQERPFYSGNLYSDAPGHSKSAFLHWGDVSERVQLEMACLLLPASRTLKEVSLSERALQRALMPSFPMSLPLMYSS